MKSVNSFEEIMYLIIVYETYRILFEPIYVEKTVSSIRDNNIILRCYLTLILYKIKCNIINNY